MPRSCAVAATVLAVALKSVRSVGAEEEEETEEIPVLTWASSIFFIILALVVLTIAFDLVGTCWYYIITHLPIPTLVFFSRNVGSDREADPTGA